RPPRAARAGGSRLVGGQGMPNAGAIAALAVIATLTLGVVLLFRAIPWSRPGPWSLIWILVWLGATAVILAEAQSLVSDMPIDPRVQLGLLAMAASCAAVALVLDRRRRTVAEGMASVEAEQRDLIAALPNPVLITDAEGRVRTVNRAAEDLFGPAAVGLRIDALLPFVALPSATGLVRAWRGRVTSARGGALDAEVQLSVVLRHGGASAVYVVNDVSELATANRLREQLLYSVAHELRQPLTVLDNTLDILSREYVRLSAQDFETLLASSSRTLHRLRSLMDQLLNAGTIESGRFVPQLRAMPLRAIVVDAVDAASLDVESRGQHVDVDVSEDLTVMADARFAQQVLANLIANASKYGPPNERIDVHAERDGRVVRVSVTDHGPGIPPEQQGDLFQRFYRVSSSSAEPGIGLGLAIAKGIVEAHGGHIGVVSELGKGTTVWFTLRLAEVSAAVGAA
ncbi:MAG TPA: HAMP domain-containing sensor histidine kinase, partial [Candidatus Limnocylindrales bacterium]|nr:HAMP domain-containing sensor histidine kinase [Candidatus Limnocylindrales bacterium]